MKKILFFCLILFNTNTIAQEIDQTKETKETIDWLNSKFVEYKFEEPGIEQVFLIDDVKIINNEYYLTGRKEQNTNNPLAAYKSIFAIPISKINSIRFEEYKSTYWIVIRTKNGENAILAFSSEGKDLGKKRDIEIILNKSIDQDNLQPRILKAFNHLLALYGNIPEEKF